MISEKTKVTRTGVGPEHAITLVSGYSLGDLAAHLEGIGFTQMKIPNGVDYNGSKKNGADYHPLPVWTKIVRTGNERDNTATLIVNALIPGDVIAFGEYHGPLSHSANPYDDSWKHVRAELNAEQRIHEIVSAHLVRELSGTPILSYSKSKAS